MPSVCLATSLTTSRIVNVARNYKGRNPQGGLIAAEKYAPHVAINGCRRYWKTHGGCGSRPRRDFAVYSYPNRSCNSRIGEDRYSSVYMHYL